MMKTAWTEWPGLLGLVVGGLLLWDASTVQAYEAVTVGDSGRLVGNVVLEGYYNGKLIISVVDSDVNKIIHRGLAGGGAICGAGNQVVSWKHWSLRVRGKPWV